MFQAVRSPRGGAAAHLRTSAGGASGRWIRQRSGGGGWRSGVAGGSGARGELTGGGQPTSGSRQHAHLSPPTPSSAQVLSGSSCRRRRPTDAADADRLRGITTRGKGGVVNFKKPFTPISFCRSDGRWRCRERWPQKPGSSSPTDGQRDNSQSDCV